MSEEETQDYGSEPEGTDETSNEETDETSNEETEKKPKKKKRRRSTGQLAMAFLQETTVAGQNAMAYIVPPDQPDFSTQKEVRDHIKDLLVNGAYEAEFDTHLVQIVRIVKEPMEVKVQRETKVTLT